MRAVRQLQLAAHQRLRRGHHHAHAGVGAPRGRHPHVYNCGIINKELGLNFCENPWQGSFIIDKLSDLVEEAVYQEFERISERGGVLGAMDTPSHFLGQRSKIQEESLYYEHKKHDGSLPIVGVNTFLPPRDHIGGHGEVGEREMMRSSKAEKDQQVENVKAFRDTHAEEAKPRLRELQKVARERKNTFAARADQHANGASFAARKPHHSLCWR